MPMCWALKSMETAGIRCDGDTLEIEDMVRTATFFDLDNNALMLAQDLTKPH